MSYKIDKKDPEYVKYTKYIRSKEFEEVKNLVFERDNYTCVACGWSVNDYNPEKKSMKRTLQCHHTAPGYRHLYHEKENLTACVSMCSVCHANVHRAPSNISWFKKPLEETLTSVNK